MIFIFEGFLTSGRTSLKEEQAILPCYKHHLAARRVASSDCKGVEYWCTPVKSFHPLSILFFHLECNDPDPHPPDDSSMLPLFFSHLVFSPGILLGTRVTKLNKKLFILSRK
jgi:hypothetical protein